MNKTEHILACIIEECAEVQQAATKALRFGLEDRYPDRPPNTSNRQDIISELADLRAVMDMACGLGLGIWMPLANPDKRKKVGKWMAHAVGTGALVEDEGSD